LWVWVAWTVCAVTDAYLHIMNSSTCAGTLSAYAVPFFRSHAFGCLEVRGRTGEPGEGIVDIDTGLVICDAKPREYFPG